MPETRTPEDVELVARALAVAEFDDPESHGPWQYTEFGTLCSCGAALIKDDRCAADWDVMPDDHKQTWRASADAVLAALVSAGRLADPGDGEEWSVRYVSDGNVLDRHFTEAGAREWAKKSKAALELVRRWVGPWQPVEDGDEPGGGR